MNSTFYGSPNLKKIYLEKWVESKSDYKKKSGLAVVFRVVALVVWVMCIIIPALLLMGNDALFTGIIAGAIVGMIFSLIPFFIGGSIKRKAFREYSFPFGNIEKECIRIFEDGIEYLYHNASSRYSGSMDVYRVALENLNAVNYDKEFHIITIIGESELLAYDDYAGKRLNYQNSQRKFYSNSPYQIILSFDEEQQIVQLLSKIAKNRT